MESVANTAVEGLRVGSRSNVFTSIKKIGYKRGGYMRQSSRKGQLVKMPFYSSLPSTSEIFVWAMKRGIFQNIYPAIATPQSMHCTLHNSLPSSTVNLQLRIKDEFLSI
jgi:hypothetical protein